MPKARLSQSTQHVTDYIRDDHDESGVVYSKTTHFDDDVLERNKRARLEGALKTGDKLDIHDGAEIVYHFQIPDYRQWARFKRKHPAIAKGIRSRNQFERERATASLRMLHPEWVVAAPGKHHF